MIPTWASIFFLLRPLLLAIFLLVAYGLSAQFRLTEWGMNREAVKNAEEMVPVDESENGIMYQANIAGLECYIIYRIADDQLYQAGYSIIENPSNADRYIDDFVWDLEDTTISLSLAGKNFNVRHFQQYKQ